MALATIEDVALELGEPTPTGAKANQWQVWLNRAERLIVRRFGSLDGLDPATVSDVEAMAVAAKAARPDAATQVDMQVDDGRVSKRYESSTGRVEILDEWWAMLAPVTDGTSGAFAVQPSFEA